MRDYLSVRGGPALMRSPNPRQQQARRRLAVICAVAGLALASGVAGSLMSPPASDASHSGPLSYYPAE